MPRNAIIYLPVMIEFMIIPQSNKNEFEIHGFYDPMKTFMI